MEKKKERRQFSSQVNKDLKGTTKKTFLLHKNIKIPVIVDSMLLLITNNLMLKEVEVLFQDLLEALVLNQKASNPQVPVPTLN